MTSVSIVLATFNGARHIARQLETLADQTEKPSELIITDDRSTDDTVAIANAFAERAPFPVMVQVNEQRLDFRANFYKGVSLAKSDIIMFCDQDDIWSPDKVSTIRDAFDYDPDMLLAYHNAILVDGEERPIGSVSDPVEQKQFLRAELPPPWHFARGLLQAFRRDLTRFDDLIPISREHFSDDILGHDRWYFFVALAMRRVAFIDCNLLKYRQHGANAFGADVRRDWPARIADRLTHSGQSDGYGAAGARSRATVLRSIALRVSPEEQTRLEWLADAYEIFAERLERRRSTFDASSFLNRAMSLGSSISHGDYRGNPWAFDPLSVFRDAIVGLARSGRR